MSNSLQAELAEILGTIIVDYSKVKAGWMNELEKRILAWHNKQEKELVEKISEQLKSLKTNHTTNSGDIWEHLASWDKKVEAFIKSLTPDKENKE